LTWLGKVLTVPEAMNPIAGLRIRSELGWECGGGEAEGCSRIEQLATDLRAVHRRDMR
jgi:hypothetical protein